MASEEQIGYTDIEVIGARTHNLKNIQIKIPRDKLVVITGVSGSGKSSLAFDTIFAEGQRRYLETFSAYARQFIGDLERPDVDIINGLSPVISIDQKTTSKSIRSTVGTITDIYDFLRLLYARAGSAYSHITGAEMLNQTEEEIQGAILTKCGPETITILASLVRQRKGHYRELFEQLAKNGYTKVRIDGKIKDIKPKMQVDRYTSHNIELIVDSLIPQNDLPRFEKSLKTAFKAGNGLIGVLSQLNRPSENIAPTWYCKTFMEAATGLSYAMPEPNTFSFNSTVGACPFCFGIGEVKNIQEKSIITDYSKPLLQAGSIFEPNESYIYTTHIEYLIKSLKRFAKHRKIPIEKPYSELTQQQRNMLMLGVENGKDEIANELAKAFRDKSPNFDILISDSYEGILNFIKNNCRTKDSFANYFEKYFTIEKCPECQGARLKPESLAFKITRKNISEIASLDMQQLLDWINSLPENLSESRRKIAEVIIKEIRKRVQFLLDVGLDYLTLGRSAGSLSGGESQRIRLATQIGTQLSGVLYILDEPSIGLHQKDNIRLIQSLKSLRDLGNSVLVVEHDKEIMIESDYIIDIGPGAGKNGGKVVNVGEVTSFCAQTGTTADYLSGRQRISVPETRRNGNGNSLVIEGATGHNLKNITLNLPLGKFVCITGVSGSGKSTIIRHTLYPVLHEHVFSFDKKPLPFKKITGLEHINKVIEIDQSPIGKTPRSNPATYTKLFDEIRAFYTQLPESQIRGYKPGRFSFNVKGGRCEECSGGGKKVIEMGFLPDVLIECPKCRGKRYNRETLDIRYKGKSISDVLDMSVEQALSFFGAHPKIKQILQTIYDVGLGYISIGQSSTTLSGGEAQRVKIATELSKRDTGKTIYILDEPTTGLHFQDIENLLSILNRLVGKGNTVLVIEHNLDVIKVADWIIDMGPGGGERGGYIIAEGTPEEIVQNPNSETGRYLAHELIR